MAPQAHQYTKRERAPRIELWFRIIHLPDGKNNENSGIVDQTVEVTLGPQNAFEFECIGRLVRRVPASRVVTGALPKKPKTKRARKLDGSKSSEPPKIVELLETAAEWSRQLDSGEVANQAEIARRERVTRARVTQILALMKLAPQIRERIIASPWLPDGTAITERALRPICTGHSPAGQSQVLKILLSAGIQ